MKPKAKTKFNTVKANIIVTIIMQHFRSVLHGPMKFNQTFSIPCSRYHMRTTPAVAVASHVFTVGADSAGTVQ